MPVGDMLAKLANGGKLSSSEIEAVRLSMNALDSKIGALSGLLDSTGRLSPDVFVNSSGMAILPHECGSLHGVTGGELDIPNTSWTTLVGSSGAATWNKGFAIDAAAGKIYCTGVPRDSVLAMFIYVTWEGDIHGNKVDIKWCADDSSIVVKEDTVPATTTGNYTQFLTHCRRTPSTETYYYVQAAQYSGGTKHVLDFNFVVARLR